MFVKTFSILLFIMLMPLLIGVSIVIYLSIGGPIIFSQTRVGKNGKLFQIYKLRTMRGPDEVVNSQNGYFERTSRVTRFIRRSKLDEIPQLFNIIAGDLVFFGPRALPMTAFEGVTRRLFEERHSAAPGIVGLSQVFNLDHNSRKRRLACDIFFVRNNTFRMRLFIFLKLFIRLSNLEPERF